MILLVNLTVYSKMQFQEVQRQYTAREKHDYRNMLFHYYEPRSELGRIARKLVTTKNTMHSEKQHVPLSANIGAIKKVVWLMQPIGKNFSPVSIPNWGSSVEIFKYRSMALTSIMTWLLRPSVSSSLVTLIKRRNSSYRCAEA